MASPRHKRLMQESLDERLSTEARAELWQQLDRDPDASNEYQRLREVDRTLRTAPSHRAPKNPALAIMTRLAEGLQPIHLSHISGLALAVGLTLVTIVAVPSLIAAFAIIIGALGSAAALTAVIEGVVRVLAAVFVLLRDLVQMAQSFVQTNPQALVLLLAFFPVGFFWLRRRNSRAATL